MDVEPGFRPTEMDAIPETWKQVSLSSVCKVPLQNGVFYSPSRKGIGVHMINVGDLYGRSPINLNSLGLFNASDSECDRFKVQDGDLFFTRSSLVPSGIAHCNIYCAKGSSLAVFDSHVIRLRPNKGTVNPWYLFRFCTSSVARRYLVSHAKTATMTTIDQGVLENCPVILPPIAEQEGIAKVLSDVDRHTETLEQLLAKKRHIKRGAMQELLTGKKRLTGFTGDWEVKRLGDLGAFLKGSGVTRDESSGGHLACIRYGEIYTHHNDYIRTFFSWISPDVAVGATRLCPGDILFAGSGETKEEIGKCVAFIGDIEAYAGGDIVILRPNAGDSLFLGYYLNSAPVSHQKASRGQGDAVVHISAGALAQIQGFFPTVAEQKAIAAVLSDMDAEIAELEQALAKACELKQGMMQELLTGRIRLL